MNICPVKGCFGLRHGSYLAVWIEYTVADCFSGYDKDGKIELGGLETSGNVRRETGRMDVWCKWCNKKIPDEIVEKHLSHLVKEYREKF